MNHKLMEWLHSGKYLPECLRDFHDQKDVFKSMHFLYQDNDSAENMPSWTYGHIYVIDWFLWFMASRGYTLQKTRTKHEFAEWPDPAKLGVYGKLPVLGDGELPSINDL